MVTRYIEAVEEKANELMLDIKQECFTVAQLLNEATSSENISKLYMWLPYRFSNAAGLLN